MQGGQSPPAQRWSGRTSNGRERRKSASGGRSTLWPPRCQTGPVDRVSHALGHVCYSRVSGRDARARGGREGPTRGRPTGPAEHCTRKGWARWPVAEQDKWEWNRRDRRNQWSQCVQRDGHHAKTAVSIAAAEHRQCISIVCEGRSSPKASSPPEVSVWCPVDSLQCACLCVIACACAKH